jgi:hypothetical protein
VVRAIEANKMEIAPATIQQRIGAHFALASPRMALRAQGGKVGQRSAENIASGHSPEKR